MYYITDVDDMIIASIDLAGVKKAREYLGKEFEVTDLREASHFLGNVITRNVHRDHME